ncbi:MAG: DEAD/DEAH box helicase [Terriglobales bacterium]
MEKFAELGLSKPLLAALKEAGYSQPTEIQEKTISVILEGKDLMASAKTGSGKTAAFALPIIDCLEEPGSAPRALVMAPTRELALQVQSQFVQYGMYSGLRSATVYGGTGYERQIRELKKGVDIIIATPGRLLDCVQRGYVNLSSIEILVLDEADRLLDLGFMPQIRRVIAKLSRERQTLMFSATLDERVRRIGAEFTIDATEVRANPERIEADSIEQRFINVNEFSKDEYLANMLLSESEMTSVLVFTRTKRRAEWVTNRLREANVEAEEIHGDLSQSQREKTLKRYRAGLFPVLVATDVAARGLDIPAISHVVNYDLPDCSSDYIHRIGRTGRAGRTGIALSFVSEDQQYLLRDIQKIMSIEPERNEETAKRAALAARKFRPRMRRRVI